MLSRELDYQVVIPDVPGLPVVPGLWSHRGGHGYRLLDINGFGDLSAAAPTRRRRM